jgi:hypothetical protein
LLLALSSTLCSAPLETTCCFGQAGLHCLDTQTPLPSELQLSNPLHHRAWSKYLARSCQHSLPISTTQLICKLF